MVRRFSGVGMGIAGADADQWRMAAQAVEQAGFKTLWGNEAIGGGDIFVRAAVALGVTESLTVGSGVANMWSRPAVTAGAAARALDEAFPGRFVLGLGVGFRPMVEAAGMTWINPLGLARRYLEGVEAAGGAARVLLAALGPRMIGMGGEAADGVIPHSMPVAHTRATRITIGDDPLLVVGLPIIPATAREETRERARSLLPALRMPTSPYAVALDDLRAAGGHVGAPGSDELLDQLCVPADPGAVAQRVREHQAAGADHVVLQPVSPSFDESWGAALRIASVPELLAGD